MAKWFGAVEEFILIKIHIFCNFILVELRVQRLQGHPEQSPRNNIIFWSDAYTVAMTTEVKVLLALRGSWRMIYRTVPPACLYIPANTASPPTELTRISQEFPSDIGLVTFLEKGSL